jgi:hypothetical protein
LASKMRGPKGARTVASMLLVIGSHQAGRPASWFCTRCLSTSAAVIWPGAGAAGTGGWPGATGAICWICCKDCPTAGAICCAASSTTGLTCSITQLPPLQLVQPHM